ncbi:MAG: hypothetical protein LOX97_02190, partial [Sphingomonas sp.]|nr:hypothetical protein [Sphingomonas sp.]
EAGLAAVWIPQIPDDFDADAYHELVERAEGGGDDGDVDGKIARVREQYDRKIAALEKKHETEVGKLNEANTKLRASMERNLIDGGLSAAMDEANIDPRHKKKLAPYLKAIGKIKLVEEDGEYSAIVETDMGEVPLSKFVSDWAGSDDGKEYVGKPTGLDAKGSDGRKIEGNPFAAASWNKTEQGRLISTDRAKAERFAKAAGFRSLDAAAAAREPVKTAA